MPGWVTLANWDGSWGGYILDAKPNAMGLWDFRDAGGYRLLSLAISGTSPNYCYTAVIRKEPGAPPWEFHLAVDETTRKSLATDMKAQGFYPSIVVATRSGAATRYAA